jgi:uncharacterized protein YoaH (UPF0181 family)
MENEKPAPRERRSLDVFDPSADGHDPHTLGEVIQRGQDVLDSIDSLQAALYGCMTPLSFSAEDRELKKLRELASELLEPIRKAQDVLELDLPLATASAQEAYFGDTWAPPEGSRGTLSPRDVLELRLRARQVGPDERTTYRLELEKQPKIPGLITLQRRRAERGSVTDEDRQARKERIAQLKADGMNRGQIRRLLAEERVAAQTQLMGAELDAIMEGREPDTQLLK